MTTYKPAGIQSMVPFIYVKNVPEYIVFVNRAFGVEVITETKDDSGKTFYATLQFDDTTYFLQEATGDLSPSSVALYLYVPDLNIAYQHALDGGAISLAEPQEQYHGDSYALLTDKWGNQWYLAHSTIILNDDQVRERRQKEEAKQ